VVVLFVLTVFVVPQITSIFDEMHQALPTVTVFLITTSSLIQSYWFVVLGGALVIAWGLGRFFNRTRRGQYMRDLIKLRAPVTGPLVHKMIIARFCRTLATLLGSGVPLLNALAVVRNVVDNRLIADVVGNAGKDVAEGKSLSATLAQSPFIPPLVVQMISVGEQSGSLEDMLSKIAEGYEQEAESSILQIMSLLEPVMILVMGLFVGFIVISILLPIFEMNQLIR
ncbi:MAG TPA: type II secretion system protein GspF, partial [Deltaproteobacteria bacterium]|nr:type II secretion system protein GspF [Deltaproteobacteria bacterium]